MDEMLYSDIGKIIQVQSRSSRWNLKVRAYCMGRTQFHLPNVLVQLFEQPPGMKLSTCTTIIGGWILTQVTYTPNYEVGVRKTSANCIFLETADIKSLQHLGRINNLVNNWTSWPINWCRIVARKVLLGLRWKMIRISADDVPIYLYK